MSKDTNLISYNGPDCNGQTVDLTFEQAIIPGPEIADTLKFSTGLSNFTGYFPEVTSGQEDCIDINNQCEHLTLRVEKLIFQGAMGVTIKGGSRHIIISANDCLGHGKETDVDIGNWSDQSSEPTTDVTLDIRRLDSDCTYVRVINGQRPVFEVGSGPYKFVFPWPWIPRCIVVPIFNLLHRLGFFH